MSMKINAGEVSKAEMFLVDPEEIDVDDSLNGRWEPHSDDEVDELAARIAEEGQLQPVTCRRVADNRLQLVFGFRRLAAIRKLNKGKKEENRIKVKVLIADCNDEEGFLQNISENKNRKSTSPIDDAHNQRKLRDQHGWSDTKIAEFYHCSPSLVTLHKKLLLLPEDVKAKVHRRELALNAAVQLVDLTPEEQKTVLSPEPLEGETPVEPANGKPEKKAKGRKPRGGKGTSTPSTGTVVSRIRKIKGAKGGENGTSVKKGKGAGKPSTGRVSRSLAECRKFFEELTGPGEKKLVRETAEFLLKFFNGTWSTNDTAEKKFKEIYA